MDIYEYIKMDHDKVTALFAQFHKSPDKRKLAIAQMIADELIVHAKSEEETFYKPLEKHFESRPDVLHGRKEHQEIEEQIKKFDGLNLEVSFLTPLIKELEKLVNHHVKEEEGDIFKEAKDVLSVEQSYAIKERMHDLKHQLLRLRHKEKTLA